MEYLFDKVPGAHNLAGLKEFLDYKYFQYNVLGFVENDPVSIPHKFAKKEDIEIAGFLAATLAWGQRKTIINKCNVLLKSMDFAPHDFITNATINEFEVFNRFVHRTFNGDDSRYFMLALKKIYGNEGGLEHIFTREYSKNQSIFEALFNFRKLFLSYAPLKRTEKHISNVNKGAGAKRLNMFLRWMVRNEGPVDFGLWKSIPPSALYMPIDVHTGNISRKLLILHRKQDDWRAVEELTSNLRKMDSLDPVKYDFALFGLGVNENF